jgi:hypothetical protein
MAHENRWFTVHKNGGSFHGYVKYPDGTITITVAIAVTIAITVLYCCNTMLIWVWINTYFHTIFSGMNIHKSQLF